MLAGGLHGIENELELEPELDGNAYTSDKPPRCRARCRRRATRSPRSDGGPRGARRRGRRPLHQHGRRRARPRSTRRSPTGSCGAASRGCDVVSTSSTARETARPPDTVVNPATEQPVTDVAPGLRRGDRRAGRAGARGVPGLARRRAGRAGPAAAPLRRGRRRPRRGARGDRGPQRRAHLGQRDLGGRQRPRLPELLLRRAGADVRPADPGARRHRRDLPRAARRGRHHRALELPDAHPGLGDGARAGRRQHGGPQAGRADPADRDPDRRAGARGRDCPRAC